MKQLYAAKFKKTNGANVHYQMCSDMLVLAPSPDLSSDCIFVFLLSPLHPEVSLAAVEGLFDTT